MMRSFGFFLKETFEDIRRHRLIGPGRAIQKRFYDTLTPLQCVVLRLLGLSPTAYFAAGDPGAS